MNIEINTIEKTLIIKGLIPFSDLIEFIKSKGFEDYSLKSEIIYNQIPFYGYSQIINTIPCHNNFQITCANTL